jgi:hypothetical protein
MAGFLAVGTFDASTREQRATRANHVEADEELPRKTMKKICGAPDLLLTQRGLQWKCSRRLSS